MFALNNAMVHEENRGGLRRRSWAGRILMCRSCWAARGEVCRMHKPARSQPLQLTVLFEEHKDYDGVFRWSAVGLAR